MATFLLEEENIFFSQKPLDNNNAVGNDLSNSVEPHYSDISDVDDFDIPSSQPPPKAM